MKSAAKWTADFGGKVYFRKARVLQRDGFVSNRA
jgi:hypothetical protein